MKAKPEFPPSRGSARPACEQESSRSGASRRSARKVPATGLHKWIARTIREARGYLRHAESEGQKFSASFHDGKIAALIDLREWLREPKTKRARARNRGLSGKDSE